MPIKIFRFSKIDLELYEDITSLLQSSKEPDYYLSLEETYYQLGISVVIKSDKVYHLWKSNSQMVIESILCAYENIRTISPNYLRVNSLPITGIEILPEIIL